jgi:hypothetical protein
VKHKTVKPDKILPVQPIFIIAQHHANHAIEVTERQIGAISLISICQAGQEEDLN